MYGIQMRVRHSPFSLFPAGKWSTFTFFPGSRYGLSGERGGEPQGSTWYFTTAIVEGEAFVVIPL